MEKLKKVLKNERKKRKTEKSAAKWHIYDPEKGFISFLIVCVEVIKRNYKRNITNFFFFLVFLCYFWFSSSPFFSFSSLIRLELDGNAIQREVVCIYSEIVIDCNRSPLMAVAQTAAKNESLSPNHLNFTTASKRRRETQNSGEFLFNLHDFFPFSNIKCILWWLVRCRQFCFRMCTFGFYWAICD